MAKTVLSTRSTSIKDKKTAIPMNDHNDLNEDVPFQRFDSPCPITPSRIESAFSTEPSSAFVALPTSPQPFKSIDTNAHFAEGIQNSSKTKSVCDLDHGLRNIIPCDNDNTSIGGEEDVENEYRPRPHSANSIASVWKSVASKTQIFSDHFSLCGAQQEYTEEDKHIPFHPSELMVPSAKTSRSKSSHTIQLRHVQSTPVSKLGSTNAFNFDTNQMRRSCSTPTKFQPGQNGSAFGRVSISTSSSRSISKAEDGDVGVFGVERRSAFNRVGRKVEHLHSSSKRGTIVDNGRSKVINDTESCQTTDDVSESSKRSFSARVQHKVKMKRRERRQQNGKDKVTQETQTSTLNDVTTKEEHGEDTAELRVLSSVCNEKSKKSITEGTLMSEKEQVHDAKLPDSTQDKVSYLPLQPENKAVEEDDILGVDFADLAFSEQHISNELSRDSPTTVQPLAYQQITDDDQPATQIPPSRPRQFRRHIRTPPTPASPSGRPCTPQPPKVLSLKTTLQGNNMSPCSQDSCAQSRMTSRSGHSKNTISTSLSGSRSVTSSVAEADREVRETNRRELRRRHCHDPDGAASVHSSDTTSTNPNTYLALTSNPPPPREGASLPVDRFFARNASVGVASHGSNASSSTINNGLEVNPFSTKNSQAMYSRSPVKINNRPIHRIESVSSNEEPPRIVSCTSKQVLPPLARESVGYSKLGFDGKNLHSSTSSKSSSGSSSSRSKGKDKRNKYQKMASPPPPCNSIPTSPISPYHGKGITTPIKFSICKSSSIGEEVVHSGGYKSVVTPEQF